MSILYFARAVAVESRAPSLDELQGSFFHAMNSNHRGLATRAGLDLSGAPRKVGLAEYVELARGQCAPKVAAEPFAPPHADAALAELADSYRDDGRAPGRWASKHLYIAHRVAAALDSSQDKLPLLQISMDVLSVHPDAGFPRWRLNATVKDNDERVFVCRILADMMRPLEDEPIPAHVAESEKTGTMRDTMHTLVWGFTRPKKGLKIRPKSKAFWKKHATTWWAPEAQARLTAKSDNQPYELVSYTVMLHPRWVRNAEQLIHAPYVDSTAHWMG